MRPDSPNRKPDSSSPESHDPAMLALLALGWTLADDARADRLLALTGMDAATLRAGVGDPTILAAVPGFLADHEPDLVACAAAIDTSPAALIAAQERLNR